VATDGRTDEELLLAWKLGEARAGEVLLPRVFEPVRRFIGTKVGSELEELVQQTFTRLVEAKDRYEGRSRARTFVLGIARNVVREHYRRRHRSDVDVEELPVQDLGAGPSTLRWRKREDELLLASLRTLPLKMQMALELFYWDDLTAREIAEILDIPEGTVGSRIGRAKTRLRDHFEGRSSGATTEAGDDASLEAWSARIREALPAVDGQPS